jgi:hypothetical protein
VRLRLGEARHGAKGDASVEVSEGARTRKDRRGELSGEWSGESGDPGPPLPFPPAPPSSSEELDKAFHCGTSCPVSWGATTRDAMTGAALTRFTLIWR